MLSDPRLLEEVGDLKTTDKKQEVLDFIRFLKYKLSAKIPGAISNHNINIKECK
jgi:hypothetical protein